MNAYTIKKENIIIDNIDTNIIVVHTEIINQLSEKLIEQYKLRIN